MNTLKAGFDAGVLWTGRGVAADNGVLAGVLAGVAVAKILSGAAGLEEDAAFSSWNTVCERGPGVGVGGTVV